MRSPVSPCGPRSSSPCDAETLALRLPVEVLCPRRVVCCLFLGIWLGLVRRKQPLLPAGRCGFHQLEATAWLPSWCPGDPGCPSLTPPPASVSLLLGPCRWAGAGAPPRVCAHLGMQTKYIIPSPGLAQECRVEFSPWRPFQKSERCWSDVGLLGKEMKSVDGNRAAWVTPSWEPQDIQASVYPTSALALGGDRLLPRQQCWVLPGEGRWAEYCPLQAASSERGRSLRAQRPATPEL